MNSECFLIKSLILFSSKNSTLSDFMLNTILVPLVNSVSSEGVMAKVPPAEDSHYQTLSSSLDLEITVTLSATK